ncbi:F-box protein [Quillaja saponaria]|uniref:F-box protein n=1 Tax=Quillaja saponaria TaxID=32244 RepID=A0AAD7M302_QUISA|nr:F-box protein [Quillaja saponaria]
MAGKKKKLFIETQMKKKPRKQLGQQTALRIHEWLPDEMLFDILKQLPEKSLMRFMCVSKSWCSLISDPKLITNTQKLMLLTWTSMQTMDYQAYEGKAEKVQCDLLNGRKRFRILGSCNGLVYIATCLSDDFFIWNPLTGESKKVPTWHGWGSTPVGFGYDHSTGDYKIVCYPTHGSIYSMKMGSWKRLENNVYSNSELRYGYGNYLGTPVNNALYWYASYNGRLLSTQENSCVIFHNDERGNTWRQVIFRFNLVDETSVLLLPPPGTESTGTKSEIVLMEFKGSLCLIQNRMGSCIEMWVLVEMNCVSKLKWIKLMTVPHLEKLSEKRFLAPIYFSRNGEVLLNVREEDEKHAGYAVSKRTSMLYSYNPTQKTLKRVKVHGTKYWSSEITYSASQVSLN